MWEKIKLILIGIFTGIGAVILLIARGKGNSASPKQADLDRNNTRIRRGFNDSGRRIDSLTRLNRKRKKDISRGKSGIKDTRRSVSDIIRDAKKDKPEE